MLVKTGTKVQHISNNAPNNLADYGSPEADERRKAGVAMAKRWLEGCAILGVKSMRMNSPQALGPSVRPNAVPRGPGDGYPRNLEIVPLLNAAIESYKEMADVGGKYGVKVTFENHWGLAADPMNIRIMIDAVNHPYCDATPDFGNWEHEHLLFSGLKALAPYTSSNVHAKYWDRWGDANDVQRSVRIMMAAGFKGTFALEYEAGPLNGVEGAKYLYSEVLAALTKAAHARYPGLPVVPGMVPWATDGAVFRAAGIPTYGVSGSFIKASDSFSHGLNERLPVESFYGELTHWYVLLKELAGKR